MREHRPFSFLRAAAYTVHMKTVHRTYALLGRLAHKAILPFFKLTVNDRHVRVRVVVLSEDYKEILLVRSWLGRQKWSLPGGGLRRHEPAAEAGAREVHEETGLRVAADHLRELGTFMNDDARVPYKVACLATEIPKRPVRLAGRRKIEMLDIGWFPVAELPDERSGIVDTALGLLKK